MCCVTSCCTTDPFFLFHLPAADLYYQITSFQYCTYNAFRHADLNVEIFQNGKTKIYAIDAKGNRYVKYFR